MSRRRREETRSSVRGRWRRSTLLPLHRRKEVVGMSAIIPVPEMYITVCQWFQWHEGGVMLSIGGKQFALTELHFNNWNFTNPSIGFVSEFQDYFPSVVVGVECRTCPQCEQKLRSIVDNEIVEAHGIPPTAS